MTCATPSRILTALRRWNGDPETWWSSLAAADRPALFRLLDVAADLPRLAENPTIASLGREVWPELAEVSADLVGLQRLVDLPVVPSDAIVARTFGADELDAASDELRDAHCVTVDGLLDGDRRAELDAVIADAEHRRPGSWGQVERRDEPALFAVFDGLLASSAFRRLTGFVPERDAFSLTLSLQSLDPAGIGWHRDLYWPKEWVGEDVFAVLYGLGDDSPDKGGAFLYHVPGRDAVQAVYRRRHQATIVWNGRRREERPLHAVSRYRTADTSRHLVILQCLRRQP